MATRPAPADGDGAVSILDVFLSNRCNLACEHCCVAVARRPGEGRRIRWEDLGAALDYFLERVRSPGPKTVVFAGGEPVLDPALLLRGVEHVARARRGAPVNCVVYTNGTLLDAASHARLSSAGARVFVSLDGTAEVNDRWRRFRARPGRSVFDAAQARLDGLPRGGVAVNMVVRPETCAALAASVRAFRARGAATIDLWVDYFASWDAASLSRLAGALRGLRGLVAEEAEKGGGFELPMLRHALRVARDRLAGRCWWAACQQLVLGADGHFYDCEACLAFPYAAVAGHRIGTGTEGVDWAARAAYMERSREALERLGAGRGWQHVCPRVYFRYAEQAGLPLAPLIENLHRVSEVFCAGLLAVAGVIRRHPALKRAYGL